MLGSKSKIRDLGAYCFGDSPLAVILSVGRCWLAGSHAVGDSGGKVGRVRVSMAVPTSSLELLIAAGGRGRGDPQTTQLRRHSSQEPRGGAEGQVELNPQAR
jgi:hypothetical protein